MTRVDHMVCPACAKMNGDQHEDDCPFATSKTPSEDEIAAARERAWKRISHYPGPS